jgi:hypothetical protein
MSHAQHESPYSSPKKTQFFHYPLIQLLNKFTLCHLQSNYHLQLVLPYVLDHICHQNHVVRNSLITCWNILPGIQYYECLIVSSFLSSVLIASCHNWFPFFLSKFIAFLIPLATWMPNLYLIPAGYVKTFSILAISTAVFDLQY